MAPDAEVGTEKRARRRVGHQQFAALVAHQDRFADAVEHRLQDARLPRQFLALAAQPHGEHDRRGQHRRNGREHGPEPTLLQCLPRQLGRLLLAAAGQLVDLAGPSLLAVALQQLQNAHARPLPRCLDAISAASTESW